MKRDSLSLQRRQTACFLNTKRSSVHWLLNVYSSSVTLTRQPQQGFKCYQNKFFFPPVMGCLCPSPSAEELFPSPALHGKGSLGRKNTLQQCHGGTELMIAYLRVWSQRQVAITYIKVNSNYLQESVYETWGYALLVRVVSYSRKKSRNKNREENIIHLPRLFLGWNSAVPAKLEPFTPLPCSIMWSCPGHQTSLP